MTRTLTAITVRALPSLHKTQIVSNILVSDTGEVTDNHLGVIFVEATP